MVRPATARSVVRTAGFNLTSAAVAGIGGILVARTLGPTLRGDYAAITSWFGVALMLGGMGQPAALCFHVARYPANARQYVATSRSLMLATGILALTAGILLAPVLGHGQGDLVAGYRIVFGTSILAFVGASYTFSLQARDMARWNIVRVSQPVLAFIAIAVLWRVHQLTLRSALLVLAATMLLQLGFAYWNCRQAGLVPGRAKKAMIRPLVTYGTMQIAALAPATINAQLDQLVLSQTVPPADLGRYAIAVSLASLPIPLAAAIGNVAFPRLAARFVPVPGSGRLERMAVLGAAGISTALLVPLAAVAHWAVPLVFGTAYSGAVPLLWILTPGAVFLACGQVAGDLLRGRGQPALVAWAQGLAAVFTVLLLLALLPVIGIYGAAIASTIAYGIALAAMLNRLLRPSRRAGGAHARRSARGTPGRGSTAP